ncbi:hypothetical protein QYE76_031679 [Lolium multiflorum]|uniref:CCHC-type domain-containing protein n=1 Tax=Lolium multiflorum TaxID=4521 RepID=A0AAD8QTM5_LOLMU|nr:hypothetical protein QYE76_031679 [Lolium multiflorum]
MHDNDADRVAFVDAAAEEAEALPLKRPSDGFADEDDLFDLEYEALRDDVRREFRNQGNILNDDILKVTKKLDTTNETVNTIQVQVTDIQRSLQALQLAMENLTQQRQQSHHEDEESNHGNFEEEPASGERGVGRGMGHGAGGCGFVPVGAARLFLHNRKTMGWLWRLHDYTEDRKIKLASSEFDGYALRWWDGNTRARQEDGELHVLTWREMKAIMQARFVPTNYLRSIYDNLTLLRQGVLTVDAYFMEMEMLMHRGRGRESLEMTMHRFIHGLKYNIKGIVRHHRYNTMNELLHHAREAESQLAEEAQITCHATGAGRFTSRASSSTAPVPSLCPASFPTSSSKPVSNVSNTKKSEPAASGSGSSMSTARNRDMACHTCGGKGHFKRDCPNRKVMIINEDDEYETGDDADPNAPEDDEMLLKLALLLCHNVLLMCSRVHLLNAAICSKQRH